MIRLGLAGKAIAGLAAAAALAHGVGAIVGGVRAAYRDGEAASDARWTAEIERLNAERERALREAIEAGRAYAAAERMRAERRADALESALEEARHADPDFDAAMRAHYPADYFVRVCDERPGCDYPDRDAEP